MALLTRLLSAVVVGFGVIFAPKAADQHWSETTSVVIDEDCGEGGSSGE